MKPIPAPSITDPKKSDEAPVPASGLITPSTGNYSNSNRRSPQAIITQAYPWLLVLSTSVAVFFGLMYINKPVIATNGSSQAADVTPTGTATPTKKQSDLLPNRDSLPGNKQKPDAPGQSATSGREQLIPSTPVHSQFEETNMRVQHILAAKSPDGHVSRIDLDVPVLYQSRNLRWSADEVASARKLLARLMDYQDKSRQLKTEGRELLADWNQLVGHSIPAVRLRADSPSLPENQEDAIAASGPADTSTIETVEIQTKEDQ